MRRVVIKIYSIKHVYVSWKVSHKKLFQGVNLLFKDLVVQHYFSTEVSLESPPKCKASDKLLFCPHNQPVVHTPDVVHTRHPTGSRP